MLGMLGLGALAAAPWLARAAPAIGRGAQTMWNLGRGMGTPRGRRQAGRAAWNPAGRRPQNPQTGRFEEWGVPGQPYGGAGAAQRAGTWYGNRSKLQQAGINVGAGLGAMALWPESGQDMPEEVGGPGVGMPYPPGGGAYGTTAGPTTGLPLHSERLQKDRDKFLNNKSLIMKHSMLVQFQYPGKENT